MLTFVTVSVGPDAVVYKVVVSVSVWRDVTVWVEASAVVYKVVLTVSVWVTRDTVVAVFVTVTGSIMVAVLIERSRSVESEVCVI